MRKIEKLKRETQNKQYKLEELRREKVELENTLEKEQEGLVNKLWKKMDKLETEKRLLQVLDSHCFTSMVLRVLGYNPLATSLQSSSCNPRFPQFLHIFYIVILSVIFMYLYWRHCIYIGDNTKSSSITCINSTTCISTIILSTTVATQGHIGCISCVEGDVRH